MLGAAANSSLFTLHFSLYLCTFASAIVMIASLFIRLVVNRFKVKIMLLDFQTTVMLTSVAVATVLSIFTLTQTNVR